MGHWCKGGEYSEESAFWVNDYQGIPLCKVCDVCEHEKLSKYDPMVLNGYNQSDIDELIEEA